MKQLFLKSNLLHIRTNEGELEVINPEVLTCLHIRHMPDGDWRIKTPGSGWTGEDVKWPVEWPYGVELIDMPLSKTSWESHAEFQQRKAHSRMPQLARLIPEEKKAESAYKTVSSNTHSCGKFEIKSHYYFEPVESSEPQEKSVSAPSESQEELWKIVYGASNTITRDGFIESMKEHFKITRKPE